MTLRFVCLAAGLFIGFQNPALLCYGEGRSPEIGLQEFQQRSKPVGATMFTQLAPEETGIAAKNEYADPRMWGDRYQEFALGAIGTGVAVGDYDNDERPDVFFVNKTGSSRLFRNLGNWRFQDSTKESGLSDADEGWFDAIAGWFESDDDTESVEHWKQGAAFVDVDNDGWLDLFLCRFGAPNQLFMNDGAGSFSEAEGAAGLGWVGASGMASFCDFNRDGWLDAYLQTSMYDAISRAEGSRDRLYLNNGDGTFVDVTEKAGIRGETLGHSATWWDYNEDGWPDLYVANDFSAPDQLYRNDSRRDRIAFTEVINSVVPHQPFSSMGADLGDVDNDGHMDLFVADMAPTSHEMDLRGMAVTRYAMRSDSPDPKLAPQYMYNAFYLNSGLGKMREAAWLLEVARTDWTWSPRFEDLDNDGLLDLHVTNGMVREYQNDDLRQRIFRTEHLSGRMRIMHSSPVLSESNLAYRNLGDLQFERVEESWGLAQAGISFGAGFGDFDSDGDMDIMFANYDAPPTVLRNDCQSGGRAVVALRGTQSNHFGVGATVCVETASRRQTRQLVVARGYLSSSEPVLHFGLGSDERIERVTVEWPSGQSQVIEDLPVNQRVTITEPGGPVSPSEVDTEKEDRLFEEVGERFGLSVEVTKGTIPRGERQPLAPFSFSRRGPHLAVGDLNGDGRDEVLLGAFAGEPARLLSRSESGAYESTSSVLDRREREPGLRDGPILIEDLDGDGDLDALLTTADPSGRGSAELLVNRDGKLGSGEATGLQAAPAFAGSASGGDFDGDGLPDVFVGSRVSPGLYPQAGRSVLLVNRDGQFEDVTGLLPDGGELGMVTDSLWSDVDQDGWLDLLVSVEWGGVRCYRNVGGVRFDERTEDWGFASAGTGLWTALAEGDFNGDGRPDYAAGNLGLNTPYQASSSAPAVLYYGDFGGRGPFQIVEARHELGRLVPWRSRKELGESIPSVLRRFESNDAYAAASLEEVLGSESLEKARRLEASELRSGVYLSVPEGGYAFRPFDRIAQIAPIQDLSVADFDGDGSLDIAATQNLYDVDPVIGRFDGGLGQLLLGDGAGGFRAVDPVRSGLVIPGDAKAIATLDLDDDGRPDLLATRSGAPTLAFRNNSGEQAQ